MFVEAGHGVVDNHNFLRQSRILIKRSKKKASARVFLSPALKVFLKDGPESAVIETGTLLISTLYVQDEPPGC
jgi:hypothetical protein